MLLLFPDTGSRSVTYAEFFFLNMVCFFDILQIFETRQRQPFYETAYSPVPVGGYYGNI